MIPDDKCFICGSHESEDGFSIEVNLPERKEPFYLIVIAADSIEEPKNKQHCYKCLLEVIQDFNSVVGPEIKH